MKMKKNIFAEFWRCQTLENRLIHLLKYIATLFFSLQEVTLITLLGLLPNFLPHPFFFSLSSASFHDAIITSSPTYSSF